MNTTSRVEVSLIAVALIQGILGDALLRDFPWGANFALWACLLAVAIFLLGRSRRELFAGGGQWLLVPIVLSPATFLWHESPQLKALNLLALLTALVLSLLRAQGVRLQTSSIVNYGVGGILTGFNMALGMFLLLFGKTEWKKMLGGEPRRGAALLRGAVFSLPPLLIFGSLLVAADAVFQKILHSLLDFDITHLVVTVFIAFLVGGHLRGLLIGKDYNPVGDNRQFSVSLGSIEVTTMLGLLDLLFLGFVAVQIRYYFGGSLLVQATTGLTYSEYCRSGFFELVTVAALVLPFLLFVHWLLRPGDSLGMRRFQWLVGIQIVLLFVIMASAVQRMRLYQAEYGLSQQRLYPTAFMGWLAVVFIWFCLTVLRGHRERFAFGAMVAGFLLVATLQALNPDAMIARTNLERARAGRIFDAHYAAKLSADAVPDLVGGLPDLNAQDRCTLAGSLLARWAEPQNPDWRTWNLAQSRAWHAVSENAASLRAACADIRK